MIKLDVEKNKEQRKLEILKQITYFEFPDDLELVNEMKKEHIKRIHKIIKEENRIVAKKKRQIRMAVFAYYILLFGGGIISLFLLSVIISHKDITFLQSDVFLSGLCVFFVVFSILNVCVLAEKKLKCAIAIILLVPCVAMVAKAIWGYDIFYAINEIHISFALSLYSFISSLLKDIKRHVKSDSG